MGLRVRERALAGLPDDLDLGRVLEDPDSYRVKEEPHRRVLRVPGPPGYYIKLFHPVLRRKWWTSFFPATPAHREYLVSKLLLRNGIATYTPVAHGWLYRDRALIGSWFVCEEIAGARNLTELLEEEASGELRQMLMAGYGRMVASVHRAGFFLRDVNAGNMLVRIIDGDPEFFVIDHEMTRPLAGYGAVKRSRDLDYALRSGPRGVYSAEDKAAFVAAYQQVLESASSGTRSSG